MRYPEITMANDQMEGVFAQAIDLDWIQDILFLTKRVKSFLQSYRN
jgi:hypothetical protein